MSIGNTHDGVGDPDAVPVPSADVVRLVLHLLAVRSAVRVGVMLNETFPDEESLEAFCNSPDTLDGLQAFVDAREDIARLAMRGEELDDARLATAIRQHSPRALESIDLLAEQIGVTATDLFAFLLRA